MNTLKLNSTVKNVTDLLAEEAYGKIERLSNGIRITARELKQAVEDYGKTILPLPEQGYKEIDVIEVDEAKPKKWSVKWYSPAGGFLDLSHCGSPLVFW